MRRDVQRAAGDSETRDGSPRTGVERDEGGVEDSSWKLHPLAHHVEKALAKGCPAKWGEVGE